MILHRSISITQRAYITVLCGLTLSFTGAVAAQESTEDLVTTLRRPVYADASHMVNFFTDQFQHSAYPRLVMPASFEHLAQLLSYAPDAQDPLTYAHSILHLFSQRLRSAYWTDPIALLLFLEKAQPIMIELLAGPSEQQLEEQLTDMLQDRLYAFVDTYVASSPAPRPYMQSMQHANTPYMRAVRDIDTVSSQWARAVTEQVRAWAQYEQMYYVRQAWMTLIDVALSRLVWNPSSCADSWRATSALAYQIIEAYDARIIPTSAMANDLLWALVTRYGYFCELMYDQLTPQLLNTLADAVHGSDQSWVYFAEDDPLMITKRDFLKQILLQLAVEKELALTSVGSTSPGN